MQYTYAKHALVLLCTTNQFLVITTKALNWNEEEFEKLKSEPLTTEMDDEAVIVFQVSNSASSLEPGRQTLQNLRTTKGWKLTRILSECPLQPYVHGRGKRPNMKVKLKLNYFPFYHFSIFKYFTTEDELDESPMKEVPLVKRSLSKMASTKRQKCND